MKVKLTPVTSWLVEVEGKKLGRFDKVSEWEGLTKIESPKGTIIFESGTNTEFDDIFSQIFSGNGYIECDVFKITPDLIPLPTEVIDNIRMPVGVEVVPAFNNTLKWGGE
jgi:hypothetical protein